MKFLSQVFDLIRGSSESFILAIKEGREAELMKLRKSCFFLATCEEKQFLPWLLWKVPSCRSSLPGWWVTSEPTRRAAGKPAHRSCRAQSSGFCP
ncbi:hypothetical protein Nmel_012764 [Mimus melanotis]